MDIKRLTTHLLTTDRCVRRAFPPAAMAAIAEAIQAAELQFEGEVRFAVEGALEPSDLFRAVTPRERAVEVFSQLRVWDTQYNNGVLIYVLLADHAVEIIADRGIHAHESTETWSAICRQLEAAFKRNEYETGTVAAIEAVAQALQRHFPAIGVQINELPDAPALLF